MESPLLSNLLNSEKSLFLKNVNSISPNQLKFNFGTESNSQRISSVKFFPSTNTKIKFPYQIYTNTNQKKNQEDELSLKKSNTNNLKACYLFSDVNFSNSYSKPTTKSTTNLNNKTLTDLLNKTEFLNKKRNFNVGSIKKNLMPTLQENSNIYSSINNNDEEEDLEKMIDFIVKSTKIYKKDKAKIIDKDFSNSKNKNKPNVFSTSTCKCKKIGCSKYSCNCVKKGVKCGTNCKCIGCANK